MTITTGPTRAERLAALRFRVRELARDCDDAYVLSELVSIAAAIDALEDQGPRAEA